MANWLLENGLDVLISHHVVTDPTFESLLIAEKVTHLCSHMGKARVWTVLNKVQTKETESFMLGELKKKKIEPLGVVHFDDELIKAGLMGTQLRKSKAREDMKMIIKKIAETL